MTQWQRTISVSIKLSKRDDGAKMTKIRIVMMALAFLALPRGHAHANDYAKGMDAYFAGKYKTAFKLLKPVAEAGDSRAHHQMAVMYDLGQGVRRNELAALAWYRIAADHDPRAQVAMAERLMEGRGIVRDQKAAIDWYREAAANGRRSTFLMLAICYRDGAGVPAQIVMAHVLASIHTAPWGRLNLAEREKIAKELGAVMTTEQRAESEALQLQGTQILSRIPQSPQIFDAFEAGDFGYKTDLDGIEPRDHITIAKQLAQALNVAIVWPDETILAANASGKMHR
jgi:Sel1 repeat